MIVLGSSQRLATVKKSKSMHIVQWLDINKDVIHCWEHVKGYGYGAKKSMLNIDGRVSFGRYDVTVTDVIVTVEVADALFEQYRSTRRSDLMDGDYAVEKDGKTARILKSPATFIKHDNLKCPVHNTRVRLRQPKHGGIFWGCSTRGETGCRISFSFEKQKLSDPDGMLGDIAAE